MSLSLFNLLVFITVFQGIILATIFFFRRTGNSLSNKLFALIILIFIINLFDAFARSTIAYQYFMEYHKVIYVFSQVAFLIGPLIYLYVKSLNDFSYALSFKSFFHIIPFVAILIYSVYEIFTKHNFIIWHSDLYKFDMYAILIQMLIYIGLSVNIFLNWEKTVKHVKKTNDKNLDWLKYFLIGFILIWFTKLQSFAILMIAKKINWCAYTESVYYTSVFILINIIITIGLINPDLLAFLQKKGTSYLNTDDIKIYTRKILQLLNDEFVYRDPELSISKFSKFLQLNSRYISELINREFKKSFIELINEYRIQESIELFKSDFDKNKSIKEVCYSVGFNSRSAFNHTFKKQTGLSPSEFAKKSN